MAAPEKDIVQGFKKAIEQLVVLHLPAGPHLYQLCTAAAQTIPHGSFCRDDHVAAQHVCQVSMGCFTSGSQLKPI